MRCALGARNILEPKENIICGTFQYFGMVPDENSGTAFKLRTEPKPIQTSRPTGPTLTFRHNTPTTKVTTPAEGRQETLIYNSTTPTKVYSMGKHLSSPLLYCSQSLWGYIHAQQGTTIRTANVAAGVSPSFSEDLKTEVESKSHAVSCWVCVVHNNSSKQ